ncbi:xanthine dehydrogenase accessory protein XdhC [soil metagenome]
MSLVNFYHRVAELMGSGEPFVVAVVVDTIGSVPQEIGARMIVTAAGRNFGTVGGGKVENQAIEESLKLLSDLGEGEHKAARSRFVNWNLEKDIGMTCGGSVKMFFEVHNLGTWNIAIFGAGHCATALVEILQRLDCHITCIDTRSDWLDSLPASSKVKKLLVKDYIDGIEKVSRDSFVLLLSKGHSTDSPVLMEIFRGYQAGLATFPYLGVIGSKAKAERLKQDIAAAGLDEKYKTAFVCPIGLPIGNNDPQEIAVSIAAQLLGCRDQNDKKE